MKLIRRVFPLCLLVLSFSFVNSNVFGQYKIVQDKELEKLIYQNNQSGQSKNHGLYTLLIFSVKNNEVLHEKFNDLRFSLTSISKIESMEVNKLEGKLEVVIDRELYSTVDFIKIFKNVVSDSEIKFIKYDEKILTREN